MRLVVSLNFKPMRGRYFEDGGLHTVKVFSYNPNNFGLFCMAGNVSEWCESAYDESSYEFMHDINPEYRYDAKKWDPPIMKEKLLEEAPGKTLDITFKLVLDHMSIKIQQNVILDLEM